MGILTYDDYKQKIHLDNLGFILLMPILIDFLSVIVRQFGMSGSSVITMALYGVSLIVIIIKLIKIVTVHEMLNDIILYLLVLFPFGVNYFWFENTRADLVSQEMLIVYLFFILLAIFSIRKIRRWDLFFEALIKPGKIAIFLAVFILLFLNYEKYLVYMGFSYALLPFICNFYRTARIKKEFKEKLISYIFFAAGMVSILVFGARAAVGFAFVYIIVFEILRNDLTLAVKITSLIILLLVVWIISNNINTIAEMLVKMDAFKDSYLLKNLLSGQLLESHTRDILYQSCVNRMSTMGLEISGFFGDRQYCAGFAYPHNIFYELIMSFGWIIGSILISIYTLLLIKGILTSKPEKREVMIFIIISMLARYVISGSYLVEGKFWVATVLIISISLRKDKRFDNAE